MDQRHDLQRRVLSAIKRGLAGEWSRGEFGKMGVSALEIAGRLDEDPLSVAETCMDLAEEGALQITYNELAGYVSVRVLDVTPEGEERLENLRQSATWPPIRWLETATSSSHLHWLGWLLAAVLAWMYWTKAL